MFDIGNVPLTEFDGNGGGGPLKKGYYNFAIAKAEYKQSQNTGSKFFSFELVGIEESNNKRKVFFNIVMEHSNPKVVEISKKTLSDLMFAIGINAFNDIPTFCTKIVGKEFKALIDIEPNRDRKLFNVVKGTFTKQGMHRNPNLSIKANEQVKKTKEEDLPF